MSAPDPSLTALLMFFGLGKYVAGIGSLLVLVRAVLPELMPFLPVADASSPGWYRVSYGILARVTGNYGNNAPAPPSLQPAGGIVPVPPSLKK